ncbi:hypothetical protein OG322_24950 [Streptomyces sp. NBC_01260]|uniref:hypothetical protein n=1 Tax=Streptomyces sp. NBC_01260 TaxID=2903801 RepID=UPI002E33D12C|nr:hypothetical protein [Streptomyces sp. NBC_01260]
MDQINTLLYLLAIADRQNRHRGWEGMKQRAEEKIAILKELVSLAPHLRRFRSQLYMAENRRTTAICMIRSSLD